MLMRCWLQGQQTNVTVQGPYIKIPIQVVRGHEAMMVPIEEFLRIAAFVQSHLVQTPRIKCQACENTGLIHSIYRGVAFICPYCKGGSREQGRAQIEGVGLVAADAEHIDPDRYGKYMIKWGDFLAGQWPAQP